MSDELYFNNELRKCLNAAGLSDCGENDQWNYWYQRVHKAHDQAIDNVTEAQRAENAKLRDLMYERAHRHAIQHMTEDELRIVATNALDESTKLRELVEDMLSCIEIRAAFNRPPTEEMYDDFAQRACELGIEVDDG